MNDPSDAPEHNQTFRDYVRVIFRQKFIVLTSIVVVMTVVVLGLALRVPMYEASVKILVSGEKQLANPYYRDVMTMQDTEVSLTQSEIVISQPVLRRVVDALQLYNRTFDYERAFASPIKSKIIQLMRSIRKPQTEDLSSSQRAELRYQGAIDALRSHIKVQPIRDTNIFTITVKDYDPVMAAVLANVVSRAYVIYDLEQQLAQLQDKYGNKHPMYIQLQNNIKHMSRLLSGRSITNEEALGSENVKIIEQAAIPTSRKGVNNKLIALAALFASFFMGIILAFIFEYMDQTIKSPHDIDCVLGIPLIGAIPIISSIGRKPIRDFKKTPKRHNMVFSELANQIRLMMSVKSFKTVLMTAASSHEGTSCITANLGAYIAGGAKKVLIIDANLHHPTMHKFFDIPEGPGLVEILTEQAKLEIAINTIHSTLSVLPAGLSTFNPLILLDSPKTSGMIEKLKSQYDLILIDGTDLNTSKEACLLTSSVDKTIFIVAENHTRRAVALRALAVLKEHKASILGAILNKRTYPIPQFVYERV